MKKTKGIRHTGAQAAKDDGSLALELYMSLEGFVKKFEALHKNNQDQAFAFILGAGASVTSEIPAAGALCGEWLQAMYVESRDFGSGVTFNQWVQENRAGIANFNPKDIAASYPYIYAKRFGTHPDQGYGELEAKLSKGMPKYGYAVLSHILAKTRHKVVITTNFDNLVADALSVFDGVSPIVCGHQALAGFAKPNPRRPVVLKVHNDLLLEPLNTYDQLVELGHRYADAVVRLLKHYTPVVIGYGGNDVSLMGVLSQLPERCVRSGIFWCYQESGPPPKRAILDAVVRQCGHVVPIPGFDELMACLGSVVEFTSPVDRIVEIAKKRANELAQHTADLQAKLQDRENSRQAAVGPGENELASDRSQAPSLDSLIRTLGLSEEPDSWWGWASLARSQKTEQRAAEVFERGADAFPAHPLLLGSFAAYLHQRGSDLVRTENLYVQAIEADKANAANLGNYAVFLKNVRKDMDRAEEFYKRAIDADPTHANNLGNYALFLKNERKDMDRAEEFYKRAIDAGPTHADNLGNYALFLKNVGKDMDRAEEFYKRAIDADPTHVNNLGNYAVFLEYVGKDMDRAEVFYKRAIDADPTHANTLGNYARFLASAGRPAEARENLTRAVAAHSPESPPELQVEIWFYALAFGEGDLPARAVGRLKKLITVDGARSPGWDLAGVVAASAPEHPDHEWLGPLASVISDGAALDVLTGWKRWEAAVPE